LQLLLLLLPLLTQRALWALVAELLVLLSLGVTVAVLRPSALSTWVPDR
jgi:hypothetical protein